MENQYTYDSVRLGKCSTFRDALSEYSSFIPSKLAELEEHRLETIPSRLAQRKQAEGKVYLTKEEVATLVDWKLSNGTYRPSLKSLVQQNSSELIHSTTTSGFQAKSLKEALATLTRLKGIGPATASLLLSTNDPDHVPFFSDELFRWVSWEDKPGCRWDRKIKYSVKEYLELAEKVREVLEERNGEVTALELEKFAYVLGRKGMDFAPGRAEDEICDEKIGEVDHVRRSKSGKRKASEVVDDSVVKTEAAKKPRRKVHEKPKRKSEVVAANPQRSLRSSTGNKDS